MNFSNRLAIGLQNVFFEQRKVIGNLKYENVD